MAKIIITFLNKDTRDRFLGLIFDLRNYRCGLRSIASAIRKFLQDAKIHRED